MTTKFYTREFLDKLDPPRPGIDYEESACPACGDPRCEFPPECQDIVDGGWEPLYPLGGE